MRYTKGKMKLKVFLRPALAVVLAFVGANISRSLRPVEVAVNGLDLFLVLATLAFGVLGFILPEVVELSGRAGIAALARQIASHIPTPTAPRISVPKITFRKKREYTNPMVVDTSAVIDGRLVEIAKTGFLYGTLLVLPSVVGELHKLADSSDATKRARGRRGLDLLAELAHEKQIKVVMVSREPNEENVDAMLVTFAKKVKAKVVTVDFNLNKVARVSKVPVLNLNELASAVKTAVLPGDRLLLQIVARGQQRQQGVGYLPDGTMVVVEQGAGLVGKKVNVLVVRVIQTAAGKMVFGKIS